MAEGVTPDANPGEEVALRKSTKIGWDDINNGSLVNLSVCDVPLSDEFSEPLGGMGVDLVVVGMAHFPPPTAFRTFSATSTVILALGVRMK